MSQFPQKLSDATTRFQTGSSTVPPGSSPTSTIDWQKVGQALALIHGFKNFQNIGSEVPFRMPRSTQKTCVDSSTPPQGENSWG